MLRLVSGFRYGTIIKQNSWCALGTHMVAENGMGPGQMSESVQISRRMTKPTKWHVRPAKTQISLGIRSDWSESSLSAYRNYGSLAIHRAHNEDFDQTGWMPRLIWVFGGRTSNFVRLVMQRIKSIWVTSWENRPSEIYDHVRLKPACSPNEASTGLETLDILS